MTPMFLAQSTEETISNRARKQVRTVSMGMSSHSVLDLSIWGKSCRSVLPENGGVEKSKNKLLFTEWKLTKTFMVCPYRLHSRQECFACPHDLALLPSPPSPVSFLLPSGFRYVPFFGCPVTGWSWGEQYLDRCWLSSAISAQQN